MDVQKLIISALLCHQGSILLLSRRRHYIELECGTGLWELPGGKPDFGEDPVDALNREVFEETGIVLSETADTPVLCGIFSHVLSSSSTRSHRVHAVYRAKLERLPDIILSDEHRQFGFFSPADDLGKLEMIPGLRSFIEQKFL